MCKRERGGREGGREGEKPMSEQKTEFDMANLYTRTFSLTHTAKIKH